MPDQCRPACSLELITDLLAEPGAVTSEEADSLLDLYQLLKCRRDAEASLRLFCQLRRRLEPRHYLAFYRLRRWLENQVVVQAYPDKNAPPVVAPVRLNLYCVEAVRRQCLCAALEQGHSPNGSRLKFAFRPLPNATGKT